MAQMVAVADMMLPKLILFQRTPHAKDFALYIIRNIEVQVVLLSISPLFMGH
jgi:hypothetical protein